MQGSGLQMPTIHLEGLHMIDVSDTDLINWIEMRHAQIWYQSGPGGGWTVQVRTENHGFIQPTKSTLREAIVEAMKQSYAKGL
jgi:hypothetical protein